MKAATSKLEKHYGIAEAARILGIPASTLKSWLLAKRLPRVKFEGRRGRVLIKESDLLSFLDAHRQGREER
ncbi:MAG: helix-turn-helix domain-containing protein [Planctomycetota bacterium]|nr:helix-turn-helix domain-containing protein [Planctomycetota bacterium]